MSAGGCQRTLVVSAPARVGPGARVAVAVTGEDNNGRAVAVRGATVTLGGLRATTDSHGHATLTAPRAAGGYAVSASARGLVPAFPQAVAVT